MSVREPGEGDGGGGGTDGRWEAPIVPIVGGRLRCGGGGADGPRPPGGGIGHEARATPPGGPEEVGAAG